MIKVENIHKIDIFHSNLFDTYFKGKSMVVFDIESMGLNPRIAEVVLAAFLEIDENSNAKITQYLLDSMEEETLLLSLIREKLNNFDIILTFNGKHFDIPFIKTRAQILGMRDMGLDEYNIDPYDLDLYLILYGHSELKKILPNLKQKTIEEYMGISSSRDDDISGAESVELFKEYLSTFDFEYRKKLGEKILLHNHDDVLQLYKLLPIVKKTNFHQAMSRLGFPIFSNENPYKAKAIVSNIKLSSQNLHVEGIHFKENYSYISFPTQERPYAVNISRNKTFTIDIPLSKLNQAEILNIRAMFIDEKPFLNYGNYTNGFLILKNDKEINYLEINTFIKTFVGGLL